MVFSGVYILFVLGWWIIFLSFFFVFAINQYPYVYEHSKIVKHALCHKKICIGENQIEIWLSTKMIEIEFILLCLFVRGKQY